MIQKLLGMPELASEHGGRLDMTTAWVHLLMLVLAIVWTIYFVVVLMRFRRGRSPVADYRGVKSHASTYLEGGIVVAEIVLLAGLSIPLWAERVDHRPPESESVVLRVVGEQFAWNVHYPGPDGKFGATDRTLVNVESNPLGLNREDPAAKDDIVTLNQLHLPVDKPAIISIRSKDVIHCFALQEMRIKQDAVPGMEIPVWFVPVVSTEQMRERKGDPEFKYEIACAQLCGLGHYRMRGFMTVHTAEDFQAWLDEEAKKLLEGGGDEFWGM
jgi:cytochrome c oxidase subunit 2